MKKLSKLVLMNLETKELSQRQMSQIKGGEYKSCGCGCCYANENTAARGSSSTDNGVANCKSDKDSFACPEGIEGDWAAWGCTV